MVITTPSITRTIESTKASNRLVPASRSSILIELTEKGCKGSRFLRRSDVQCMTNRITIGRVKSSSSLRIDDRYTSRLHAAIECSFEGLWTFRDLQSTNASILNGETVHPLVPYELHSRDRILIGRVRFDLCHELRITIDVLPNPSKLDEPPVRPRKLSWRRSLHCDGCMGWGRRHSCSLRLSVLQRAILDANRKSNLYAPRPRKTLLQKAQMKRLSFWWPKKKGLVVEKLKLPERYEDDIRARIRDLPASP